MTTRVFLTSFLATALALATPRAAQLGSLGSAFGKAQKIQEVRKDLIFTDAEEEQLGSQISQKLRDKYGVVQDKAIHKYVTLVGTVLAQASSRPNLKWTFIVLDTDGINAFAAPGGYVHITRGALALLKNESELGDVLGHEISHVTQKHTIKAIQKANVVSLGAQATRQDVLNQAADSGYQILFQNGFDRKDEMEADELGVKLANSVGYSPTGLGAFLSRLADRDKGLTEPSGLFASHPDTRGASRRTEEGHRVEQAHRHGHRRAAFRLVGDVQADAGRRGPAGRHLGARGGEDR